MNDRKAWGRALLFCIFFLFVACTIYGGSFK